MVTSSYPAPLPPSHQCYSNNKAFFRPLLIAFIITLGSIGCAPIELEMTTCDPLPRSVQNLKAADEDLRVSGYWVLEIRRCDLVEEPIDDQFLLISSKVLTIDHHLGHLYLASFGIGGGDQEGVSSETPGALSMGYHLGEWRASPPPELSLPPSLFEDIATFDQPLSVEKVIRGDEGQIDLITGATTLLYRFETITARFILRRIELP
jgi:hypothetical protein